MSYRSVEFEVMFVKMVPFVVENSPTTPPPLTFMLALNVVMLDPS